MQIALADLRWDGHHMPYVIYLSQYFTEQDHRVTFITHENNPRLAELPDSKLLDVRAVDVPIGVDSSGNLISSLREQGKRVKQLLMIYRIARTADVDVVHLLYFDRTQIPLWFAGKLTTQPLPPTVATLHRDAFLDNSDRSILKVATQAVTKQALNSTLKRRTLDCLTVHANSIRDRVIGAVPAATRENTRMLPAPTPELSVDVSQSEARDYLGLPPDQPLFLFFGGLRYEKGPDLLAEALQEVEEEMTVIFAGPESDFTQVDVDEWKQHAPPHVAIEDRIGFIPESEVDYYFLAADALLLPYRRRKGISGPLRRAARASTPIIGTRRSDIGDIIEENRLGEVVEEMSNSGLSPVLDAFAKEDRSHYCNFDSFVQTRHWRMTGTELERIYHSISYQVK